MCEDKTFLFSVNFLPSAIKSFVSMLEYFLNIITGVFGYNTVEILAYVYVGKLSSLSTLRCVSAKK